MNYISLDLEMNHDDDGRTREVIQVGYVIGDGETGEILETRNLFVKNKNTRPLKPFIVELTGITDEIIDAKGQSMQSIYDIILRDMAVHDVFMNPITWGGNDSAELREWINAEDNDIIKGRYAFGRRWIDCKTMYVMERLANGRHIQGGLKNACRKLGIQFDGPAHDATQDAINTFKVFMHYREKLKE